MSIIPDKTATELSNLYFTTIQGVGILRPQRRDFLFLVYSPGSKNSINFGLMSSLVTMAIWIEIGVLLGLLFGKKFIKIKK